MEDALLTDLFLFETTVACTAHGARASILKYSPRKFASIPTGDAFTGTISADLRPCLRFILDLGRKLLANSAKEETDILTFLLF